MGSSHFTNSTSLTAASSPGRGGRSLPIGKLPVMLLRIMLARYARARDPRVIVGAGIGLDAAALDVDGQYVIVKTDPITFVTEEIGAYALAINANDLATMGALPRWFLATILLPAGTTTSPPAPVSSWFASQSCTSSPAPSTPAASPWCPCAST